MRIGLLGSVLAVGVWAQGAAAQEVCAEAPVIVQLAGVILDGRQELSGLHQRRHGAEAAYLALHYGGIEAGAARDLMAELATAGVAEAREALVALVVTQDGVEAGLAVLHEAPLRAFAGAGLSVGLAVMRADAGESYFRLMAEALAQPDLAESVMHGGRWSELVMIAAGRPEAEVVAMVEVAAGQGLSQQAHLLAATLADGAVREAVVAGLPPLDDRDTGLVWQIENAAGLWHRLKPGAETEGALGGGAFDAMLRAAWHDGPAHFSSILVNQTGWEEEGRAVASRFLAEVAAGRIDPVADPEASWLFQYRAWADAVGRDALHGAMRGWDFPQARLRHFGGQGQAATSFDWMLAAEALGPVVRDEVAEMPKRPELMTDGFDWELWRGLATELAIGPVGVVEGDEVAIAVELLIAAERWDELLALTAKLEASERLAILRDAMQRLDLGCDAWMAMPGQALVLGGSVVWRY
jgi:hypothetical protein